MVDTYINMDLIVRLPVEAASSLAYQDERGAILAEFCMGLVVDSTNQWTESTLDVSMRQYRRSATSGRTNQPRCPATLVTTPA